MQDITDVQSIRKMLEGTNYQDLAGKFQELGLDGIFKAGVKKVDLINDAIEKLEFINEQAAKAELEAASGSDSSDEDPIEDTPEPSSEDVTTADTDPIEAPEEQPKKGRSVENIKRNIKNCELNLLQASTTQRLILLKKLNRYKALLGEE